MVLNIDVDKIVNYLEGYRDTLPQTYTWDISIDRLVPLGVLSSEELYLAKTKTPYDKGIYVKEVVPPVLNRYRKEDLQGFYDLCYWVISDWGGIRGFKRENVPALVETFLESDKPSFERIPSASKVGSYMFPEKYVAYDSRLAYALNWALLFTGASDIFFPIPSGRNTKLASFPMEALIKLKYRELYRPGELKALDRKQYINERDDKLFVPKEEAFVVLVDLVRRINRKLHPGDTADKLYLTEILLFSIADKEVFRDITTHLSLSINS